MNAQSTIETPTPTPTDTKPLLEVENLKKYFPIRGGVLSRVQEEVRAVDGVSFSLGRGRTLGLVGESGCGKTTVGRTLLRLIPPTDGRVLFNGRDVFELPRKEMRDLRRDMQIIFQDPYASLNPRMTVGSIIGEPLRVHGLARGAELRERVGQLIEKVGFAREIASRYPHEFSGGQRQRIGVARALALEPDLIVCDEPTSALDVSIRAQVINLLDELQLNNQISYLMISHDLAVVRHISHEVAVMYLGKIVEQAPTETLFRHPRHPYTRVLLSAIPVPDPSREHERVVALDDEIPSPINVPPGCAFHPRCPLYAMKGRPADCREKAPLLRIVGDEAPSLVSCHFAEETEQHLAPPTLQDDGPQTPPSV